MSFIERATEALRTGGGRMTPQREIILETLASTTERVDAESLYQLVQEQDSSINLTTIYRTLNTLEKQGLIRQQYTSPDHDRKCYTLIPETYHFTCQKCGKVIAFGSDKVAELTHALEINLDLKVLTTCMCVTGLCPSCWAEAQHEKEDEAMPSTLTLDQLTPGQTARVTKVGGAGAVRRRLMDMGVVRGVEIELVKAAPLGDPLEYLLRGYHLSLRKSEAQFIEVDL